MSRGVNSALTWGLVFFLALFLAPQHLSSQTPGKGRLIGFVFGNDGSTPAAGAVVVAKNVTTGAVVSSTKTDSLGTFKIDNLETGIYALGVTSGEGSFNSQDLVGIKPDETAKVSIALSLFDRDAIEAARAVAKDEKERGESLVGKIVAYVPASREAVVLIERGLLQAGDRVRIRGPVTDFFQDIKTLKVEGSKARLCLTGQQGLFSSVRACAVGDGVYVVCKRGVPPLFLAPLGMAAIVAGSATLVSLEEEESVSPTKPPKK